MSEVDRLSNSGLFPALPIADRQNDKGGSGREPPPPPAHKSDPKTAEQSEAKSPRPPKSIIDEYA